MTGPIEPDTPDEIWIRGLSRFDFAFGTGFCLLVLVLLVGAPWYIMADQMPTIHELPEYMLLVVGVTVITLYLALRWLDHGLRRVAVVHQRLVARDPEVVWGLVVGYLTGEEVRFRWTTHNPIFTGRQERRLSLEPEEGPGIEIVVKAPARPMLRPSPRFS